MPGRLGATQRCVIGLLLLMLLASSMIVSGADAPVEAQAVGDEFCAEDPAVSTRCAEVGPRAGLRDGQIVEVAWQGLTPGVNQLTIYQCSAAPSTVEDCAYPQDFLFRGTGGNGSGKDTFRVFSGPDNPGFRFTEGFPAMQCDATHPCSLAIFDTATPFDRTLSLDRAVIVPIAFARGRDLCPAETDRELRGEGGWASDQIFLAWTAQVCEEPLAMNLDVTTQSSPAARADFLRGRVDFGVTTMAASTAEIDRATDDLGLIDPAAKPPKHTYAPVATSGLVLAYRLRDRQTTEQVNDMTLTPDLVARYFFGGLQLSADPAWKALNKRPDGTDWLLPAVLPVMRAETSDDTYLVTDWLWHEARPAYEDARLLAAAGDLSDEDNPYKNGPQRVITAAGNLATLLRGDTAANAVVLPPSELVSQGAGVMAIVDSSLAARLSLSIVRLVDDCGDPVALTPESLAAAVAAMEPNEQGTLSINWEEGVPCGAWPLPKVSWMMVPTDDAAGRIDVEEVGPALRQLVSYAVGDGQDADPAAPVLPVGYLPLTPELRTLALERAAKIPVTASPTSTTTTSTTQPVTSGTSPDGGTTATTSSFASGFDTGDGSLLGGLDAALDGVLAASDTPDDGSTPDAAAPASDSEEEGVGPMLRQAGARYLLPALALFGLLALVGGPVLERVAVRRRPSP